MSSDRPSEDQPLAMTVHSMPQPLDLKDNPGVRTRVGRWKMLAVLLVCAAPVIASYFTYYVIRPEGRRNFGQLMEPQRPMPDLLGTTLAGDVVRLQSLKGQWLLVSVAGAACDELCVHQLYVQRQLREGLAKDKDRLDWVWLIDDQNAVPDVLQKAVKQAVVIRVPKDQLSAWLQPEPGHALNEHLYVIDPMGNWMMRFPPNIKDAQAPKVKRDLERLMRASAFWDNAGR